MKLISLNTWGGEAGLPRLLDFFRTHTDVDFFCLQEVWNGGEHMLKEKSSGSWMTQRVPTLLREIQSVLSGYEVYYCPHFYDFYGLALFYKKSLKIVQKGEFYIYKEKGFISPAEFGDHARILQYVTFETSKGLRTVINLHGLWNGKGKSDSEDRLEQSDRIIELISKLTNPFVIVGDFNLHPNTASIKKLEDADLRNLIKEYGIPSTRTSFYTKPEKYADYAFASKDVHVENFEVLPEEVSDHSALLLQFE